jgi:hypothetical protein
MGRQKGTDYLTKDQMEALSTERLLAYRKSLLKLPEWRVGSDAAWWRAEHARALEESKAILDNREHVQKD